MKTVEISSHRECDLGVERGLAICWNMHDAPGLLPAGNGGSQLPDSE